MKTSIIKIGNSQGIRIPRPILEQCGFYDEVEVEVKNQQLILSPVQQPRQSWEKAFQRMALLGDDGLLDAESGSQPSWDDTEWEWT